MKESEMNYFDLVKELTNSIYHKQDETMVLLNDCQQLAEKILNAMKEAEKETEDMLNERAAEEKNRKERIEKILLMMDIVGRIK